MDKGVPHFQNMTRVSKPAIAFNSILKGRTNNLAVSGLQTSRKQVVVKSNRGNGRKNTSAVARTWLRTWITFQIIVQRSAADTCFYLPACSTPSSYAAASLREKNCVI